VSATPSTATQPRLPDAMSERLRQIVAGPDEDISLAEAALLIAGHGNPGLNVSAYLNRIDELAYMLRLRIAEDEDLQGRIAALNHFLFGELGFGPNADDYYDPRNSFLNEVLERRVGIPITLSVIYLELGRRVGLPLQGVSFPGHFLVKCAVADGTVVIDGNRITAVGPRASTTVPAGAKVIDVAGKTIMPGIVDVHWHGSMGADEIIPQQSWVNYAALAFGVTTLHDPSNNSSEIFTAAEMQRAGEIVGPRIFSTGTILYGAKGSFKADIANLDDALFHLKRMKAIGAISVKSYNQPRRDQRQQIIEAARETGMMVVPEGGSLFEHNMTMVVDGHTGVEHSIPVAKAYDDVTQLWSKSHSGYTPTLIVGYGGLWGENYWYAKTNVFDDKRLLAFVPRRVVDARSRRRTLAPDEEWNHFNNAALAKKLNDAGVSVQLGAHGQREGLGAHWELWMFVQGGMTPMQAIRAATLSGARYIGMDKDVGSLEAGKLADLLVLDENPLENIRNSESIRYTIANGRIFDAMTMNELGNHPRTRQPFYFELPGNDVWGRTTVADTDD